MRRYTGTDDKRVDRKRFRLIRPIVRLAVLVRCLAPAKSFIGSRPIRSFPLRSDRRVSDARSLFYRLFPEGDGGLTRFPRRVRVATGDAEMPTRRKSNKMAFSDPIPRTYVEQAILLRHSTVSRVPRPLLGIPVTLPLLPAGLLLSIDRAALEPRCR